ncbi:MAG: hypothetical protein U1E87_00750 [Alphaproteobacteria bacterium]
MDRPPEIDDDEALLRPAQPRLYLALDARGSGLLYEIARVDIRAPDHPTPAYKKINPMGKVAGLEDGGTGFGETAAILLCRRQGSAEKLSPPLPIRAAGAFSNG